MEMSETPLGRLVPIHERQTFLEDSVLKVLFEYRMSPHNPNNVPMKLVDIVRAVAASEAQLVVAALDALKERTPPLVEERESFQQNPTFRITGSGVGFVRNLPQGVASVA